MKPHIVPWARARTWLAGSLGNSKRRSAVACFALIAACPVAARAPEEAGPTAAASIGISLSVATRYGLSVRAAASGPQGLKQRVRGRYCLASNEREMHLPVMLVRVSASHGDEDMYAAAEEAIQLLPCSASGKAPDDTDVLRGSVVIREFIVSPE